MPNIFIIYFFKFYKAIFIEFERFNPETFSDDEFLEEFPFSANNTPWYITPLISIETTNEFSELCPSANKMYYPGRFISERVFFV